MSTFQHLSDEQLGDEIATWAGRIAAGEAHQLALVGEFDRREAWAGPGLLSCAHWLSWRTGMGLVAARERVRVARALRELPLTAAALRRGRLSWTQVRAITRVAVAEDEPTWLELARHASGAQIQRLVRGVRRAQSVLEAEADPELAAYRMRTRVRYDEDGTLVLSVRVPAEQGPLVLAALEQAREQIDRARRPAAVPTEPEPDAAGLDDVAPLEATVDEPGAPAGGPGASAEAPAAPGHSRPVAPPRATLGEAMLHLANEALARTETDSPGVARRHRARLSVHVDPLSGWGRVHDGELLPPSSMRRVPPMVPDIADPRGFVGLRPLGAADLTEHDLGRRQRAPSPSLRDLLTTVDGERCRFPGCTSRRHLHAHHVTHWSAGGPTDLANLVLLCPRHHTIVHARNFLLELGGDRGLTVTTPGGRRLPHRPGLAWQPAADLDPQRRIGPHTLPPTTSGDRLDLRYAVSVLVRQAA